MTRWAFCGWVWTDTTCGRRGAVGQQKRATGGRAWAALAVLFGAIGALPALADPIERTTQKGPVEATVRLDRSGPVIGDLVTLTLKVAAQSGVELLMPAFGQALERFAISDFTSSERVDQAGRTVVTQQYDLELSHSGPQSIPPVMIEFVDRRDGHKPAPDGFDAYELLTERLAFEVQSVVPDDAQADLRPSLGTLPLQSTATGRLWPWGIGVLVLLLAAAGWAWRWWTRSRRQARRRSAYEIASGRLEQLLSNPQADPDQLGPFFVDLSAIVRQYLEDRFELRAGELTTEEFLAQASGSPDLVADHQALLRAFLRRADLVKFANMRPTDTDVQESVAAARRFLDETRQEPAGGTHPPSRWFPTGVARV